MEIFHIFWDKNLSLKNYKSLLDQNFHSKHKALLSLEAQNQYLIGKLLLQYIAKIKEYPISIFNTLKYNSNNKPILNEFEFNTSHFTTQVVVSFSPNTPSGIDIQKVFPLYTDYFKPWISTNDWLQISKYPNTIENNIFEIWSKKEAFCKLLGGKLVDYIDVDVFQKKSILYENKEIHFTSVFIKEGFICFLATINIPAKIKVIEITLETIFRTLTA